MDIVKEKWKKNLIFKTWERCRTLGSASSNKSPRRTTLNSLKKSKSWHCNTKPPFEDDKRKNKCKVAPEGCFSVYVGHQKQRFVIKTEFVNHPLFKMLLEDAELEYGYNSEGPIMLPCDVDLFYKVLAEMDSSDEITTPGCSFKGYGSFSLCSPSRRPNCGTYKDCGSYSLLSPSRMLQMNQY